MDNASIKNNIYNFRKSRKMTQEEVANLLDISVTAYRELERGSTSVVNPNIVKMADVMDTSTEELVLGYYPVQAQDISVEDIREEYGNKVNLLEKRIVHLEKLVGSLEETIASKNEIITMLKKMLGEQK